MTIPLIAVAVTEAGQVSPHGGRALIWHVYAVDDGRAHKAWELHLTDTGCLHEWHVKGDGNRHPLHNVDVALAGSAGDGVIRRLAERNTELVTTSESAPTAAVEDYLAGTLAPGLPHDEGECLDPEHHASLSV